MKRIKGCIKKQYILKLVFKRGMLYVKLLCTLNFVNEIFLMLKIHNIQSSVIS